MDIYAQNIMDHFKNPRNYGEASDFDFSFHEINTSCGDDITVFIKMKDGVVSKINFVGNGCAISKAGISMLTTELIGKTKEEILALDFEYIKNILGVEISERRYKCAMIGLSAISNSFK